MGQSITNELTSLERVGDNEMGKMRFSEVNGDESKNA